MFRRSSGFGDRPVNGLFLATVSEVEELQHCPVIYYLNLFYGFFLNQVGFHSVSFPYTGEQFISLG